MAEYTYDPLGNPATLIKNGTTYYYHLNGHGDVVALTDGSGNTVAEYNYDAWDTIISQTGTMASANPIRYAGYRYDEVTGLYYLMARNYDPEIGRFITRNTFHGFDVDPQSLNLYAYAQGNPVKYVDPSGHIVANVFGTIIGAGLGGLLGKAIADYYGLTGWKKIATIAGFIVGGSVIGWFAGPIVARLATKFLPLITSITPEVSKLDSNKINHILQSKHAWNLVVKDPKNWNQVSRIVSYVLKFGKESPYKSALQKVATVGRHQVVVVYKYVNGVRRISDAWVKTQ